MAQDNAPDRPGCWLWQKWDQAARQPSAWQLVEVIEHNGVLCAYVDRRSVTPIPIEGMNGEWGLSLADIVKSDIALAAVQRDEHPHKNGGHDHQ